MLLRNTNSTLRNIRFSFQLLDYQKHFEIKECLGQNKEHSIRIKLKP